MAIAPLSLRPDYWDTFQILDTDLEFLYNFLLEIETPQTPQELTRAVVDERIRSEKQALEKEQKAGGDLYLPKNEYQAGQTVVFPAFGYEKGQVTAVREGRNPEFAPFSVIAVAFENGEKRQFAAGLQEHVLNQPVAIASDDPLLNSDHVIKKFGQKIAGQLTEALEANEDLVRIAGRWFPRALLVDVNIGHLNLAEAVLDMEGGGPLPTKAILDQIELPSDSNLKLTEFSLNLALQEDGRFDEVGPSGEVLWFLRRLEPDPVKEPPSWLKYRPIAYDAERVRSAMKLLDPLVCDELEPNAGGEVNPDADDVRVALVFAHWRAGTLPLCCRVNPFLPTAYESPRVRFTFIDGDSGQKIDGWIVREYGYAYGLRDWYIAQGIFPGSIIHIQKGKTQGEVIIRAEKRRPGREWIRTALVGADGGVVFAMLKQLITTTFDDHLATAIPDPEALDQVWTSGAKSRGPLENTVISMMRELAKLNPQGSVHAQDLYATVNLVRRTPPGPILSLLVDRPWSSHMGDLYFRLNENIQEENTHD
ncbi:MAG TPA: hypothetical protein VIO36_10250 [Anaerolineaceae bacterium]